MVSELKEPNVIYILADDSGYRDLSYCAQVNFQTPNIDESTSNGMKFIQHYSSSAVYETSRFRLMIGEHTGHTPIRGNKELKDQKAQTPVEQVHIQLQE